MNKKNKLICVSVLCSLFLISAINVSNAAPPSWVGVSTGDTFTWRITVNVNTALNLVEDLGISGEIPPGITTGLGNQEEVKLKVRILAVTDQMTHIGVNYVNVSCMLSIILPETTTVEDVAEFGHIIVEYDPTNYTQELFEVLGTNEEGMQSIAGLFMPTDINWASFVTELNILTGMIPDFPSGIIITALANGASVTIPSGLIEQMLEEEGLFGVEMQNMTLDDLEFSITYNDNGVLDTAEVIYGTDVLFELVLESVNGDGDEIPSYEISIVLITTIASTIGIIYYIKRKKHIL
ncbi:hypothetical protein LCGC14_1617730 [marine sediment metagenome]|uniref:Uncharacterized protein n=1 Tax=marine sediment metagenome TaxID=412755 RepID=A0A0F9IT94_9ZZZZ